MKEAKNVVVHGGMCHRDDFMAIGLLKLVGIIGSDTVVRRTNPTQSDLMNPDIPVIDVGGQLDPARNNWDHHQHEENVKDECAFSLLCKNTIVPVEYGFEGTFHDLWQDAPWHKAVNLRDNLGPDGLARKFGLPFMPHEVTSPLEGFILGRIGDTDTFDLKWIELAAALLESQLEREIEFRAKEEWLHENGRFQELIDEEHGDMGCCVFIADQKGAFGINPYVAKWGPGKDRVIMTATRDHRSPSWALYRLDAGVGRVNLAKLKDHKDVTFAHPKGFLAIINPEYTWEQLMAIAMEAIV